MPARIPASLVAHLDDMAARLISLARETTDVRPVVFTTEAHAGLDRDEAYRTARNYAADIGKVTEVIEMSKYRMAEINAVQQIVREAQAIREARGGH